MRKIIERTEIDKWHNAEYPYDPAECGLCATQHSRHSLLGGCAIPAHDGMRKDSDKLPDKVARGFRKSVLTFRKKWAKYYPIRVNLY
jgi:hypothetical protein